MAPFKVRSKGRMDNSTVIDRRDQLVWPLLKALIAAKLTLCLINIMKTNTITICKASNKWVIHRFSLLMTMKAVKISQMTKM